MRYITYINTPSMLGTRATKIADITMNALELEMRAMTFDRQRAQLPEGEVFLREDLSLSSDIANSQAQERWIDLAACMLAAIDIIGPRAVS